MLRHLDLFSGIGGFALAAQMVGGIETKQFVEIEPYAQKVLAKNFPGVPIHDDVTTFVAKPGQYDLITGGFPCQDISSANPNGRGLEGERSGLFYELMRIVRECRPAYLVLENVPAMLSKQNGRIMGTVLRELSESGYDAEWQVISAASVGAPHLRERVFIVAYSNSKRRNSRRSDRWKRSIHGNKVGNVPETSSDRKQLLCVSRKVGEVTPTPTIGESQETIKDSYRQKQMGYRDGSCWGTEPGILRVVDGVSPELDILRGLEDEQINNPKSKSEVDFLVWKILRGVWEHQDIAASSPSLYVNRLHDCVPEMPRRDSHEGWNMGQRLQKDEGLRDLWQAFYSKSFQEAQDLQQVLLERIRQAQRRKKMERVPRIRGLGNAIVPQCGAIALQRVLELHSRIN